MGRTFRDRQSHHRKRTHTGSVRGRHADEYFLAFEHFFYVGNIREAVDLCRCQCQHTVVDLIERTVFRVSRITVIHHRLRVGFRDHSVIGSASVVDRLIRRIVLGDLQELAEFRRIEIDCLFFIVDERIRSDTEHGLQKIAASDTVFKNRHILRQILHDIFEFLICPAASLTDDIGAGYIAVNIDAYRDLIHLPFHLECTENIVEILITIESVRAVDQGIQIDQDLFRIKLAEAGEIHEDVRTVSRHHIQEHFVGQVGDHLSQFILIIFHSVRRIKIVRITSDDNS